MLPSSFSPGRPSRSGAIWVWGVLATLIAMRLVLIAAVAGVPEQMLMGDSLGYEGLALGLLERGHYEDVYGNAGAAISRPPGYPALIAATYALTGRHLVAPVLWNVVGTALTYLALLALLGRLGVRRPSRFVGAAFVLDLAWLLYSKELVTEPIFTPLLLGALLLAIDGTRAPTTRGALVRCAGAGVALGVAALVKPIALYLPLVLALWIAGAAWRLAGPRRAIAGGLALLLGAAVCIGPWVAYNAHRWGAPTFTRLQNDNLLFGHAAFVEADRLGLTHLEAKQLLFDRLQDRLGARLGPGAPPVAADRLDEAKGALARDVLAGAPLLYTRALLRGAAATFLDPGRLVLARTLGGDTSIGLTNTLAREGLVGTVRLALGQAPVMVAAMGAYGLFLAVVLALALVGIPGAFRSDAAVALLLFVTAAYLVALGGPHGYARFRLYVFPFELAALHFGVRAVGMRWRRFRAPHAPALSADG
jgi:4-amino-4-deoxy-L-arabinose transferase-like glycosyltransferase